MDENEFRQWLIDCFGEIEGARAWEQINQLPPEIREQLTNQNSSKLPSPEEMRALMQNITGTLNSSDSNSDSINTSLATTIASNRMPEDTESTINAQEAEEVRFAIQIANLWLDSVCVFNPVKGDVMLLTRKGWVDNIITSWATYAQPVSQSMNNALTELITKQLGDAGSIQGFMAGPVPFPFGNEMNDPSKIINSMGNTSVSMELGQSAGTLSSVVRGSFDQGLVLLDNPAGGIIVQNCVNYADQLGIDKEEVFKYVALQECAHARLFNSVPWLKPRIESLIGKYARGINIDMNAIEDQMRDMDFNSDDEAHVSVPLDSVRIPDTPEQKEALHSLENLIALIEGWVDCVTRYAGMAHITHIEQIQEMIRRERAATGAAQKTFSALLGLNIRPKMILEATQLWTKITAEQGEETRDAMWNHPDLLPTLDEKTQESIQESINEGISSFDKPYQPIDWDAELDDLLLEDQNNNQSHDDSGQQDNNDDYHGDDQNNTDPDNNNE
ncbi:MAG: zinc-dependent metalloprotease [Bifidobacteriaceae bacterium]|nr:zinc-dependent metalloprotease [Bifidobacteriaceae bacterium]